MVKPDDPRDLVVNLLARSQCNVQVAAVIVDNSGRIIGWGWNSSGPDGLGLCAERHAIKRSNGARLAGSVIYVAGEWKKSGKFVSALPCRKCLRSIRNRGMRYVFRDADGGWKI